MRDLLGPGQILRVAQDDKMLSTLEQLARPVDVHART
jgi:hypothetical protein